MASAPAFQIYASDLLVDTLEWDIDEVGIYTRLLMAQWANKDLPDDIDRLARVAGCSPKRMQKAWKIIRCKFSKKDDGRLINLRLEETRKTQDKYREKQSNRAKSRYEQKPATADATADATAQPQAMPEGCSSSSSSSLKNNTNLLVDHQQGKTELSEQPKPKPLAYRWTPSHGEQIDELMNEISQRYGMRFHGQCLGFTRGHFNHGNPDAIIFCLRSLIKEKLAGKKIDHINAWLEAAFRDQDGKHNAREHEAIAEEFKRPVELPGNVKALLGGVGGRASP